MRGVRKRGERGMSEGSKEKRGKGREEKRVKKEREEKMGEINEVEDRQMEIYESEVFRTGKVLKPEEKKNNRK